ncbi:MAG: hypothetical protein OHK0022_43510 [Roseiflexaceae bacterium]
MFRHTHVRSLVCVLLLLGTIAGLAPAVPPARGADANTLFLPLIRRGYTSGAPIEEAIVFVSRQIPRQGSIYWDVPNDMPGVGGHSRFRPAAPGKLIIREPMGQLRVLVDGSRPTAASLNLIDVNAPDVSYDGTQIVFAGLPQGSYPTDPARNPGAWRIYVINVDGSGLRQLTFDAGNRVMSQFGQAANGLTPYDDTDPVWLPDGRIVFSSTRWPSYAQYSGVRTTNLFVINQDSSNLHRITAERNGADRPLVDPLTGKIVYSRWWRNHRFPASSLNTVTDPNGGYRQFNGLTSDRSNNVGGEGMFRNAWHLATINPDGTELAMWTGSLRDEDNNHTYGGAFSPDGVLYANFFPMINMTEASGFGGIRRYTRGPGSYTPVTGITKIGTDYVFGTNASNYSYGIYKGSYAAEPDVLRDERLVMSWARDYRQDYGLYLIDPDGKGFTLVYDNPGTSELRARAVRPRKLPPIIPDSTANIASALPPTADGPYDQDGTFIFHVLNIYANAPVDVPIVNAPAIGSAATLRFFIDHQRTSPGSFPNLDWPIMLAEAPVPPSGEVRNDSAPANVPLFEQLRGFDGSVPKTFFAGRADGTGHVAGMNFGRPGEHSRCVGCHAGHSMMPVPPPGREAEAQWTNLATGAQVTVSSARDPRYNGGVNDRRVLTGEIWRYWTSAPGQAADGQWVQLTFPVPVTVRTVRLYGPRQGDEARSSLQVRRATVQLFADTGATQQVGGTKTAENVAILGTDVPFSDLRARVVRVRLDDVEGTFYGAQVASLAEIEVIASGK